jgi:hypothetical protein
LNLIRVMPAKGQDMTSSIFLAKLIGPFALALGLTVLLRGGDGFRTLVNEFAASPALIFLSGIITLPAGLAIVITHNVWTPDWRVVITIIGWLAVITGVIRTVAPERVAAKARTVNRHPMVPKIGAAVWLAIGALLCFYGYYHH